MIHDMQAVEEVGDKGVPNQLGSRQHKKVIIILTPIFIF